jgi:outer membrane protein, heavy metal efflux system
MLRRRTFFFIVMLSTCVIQPLWSAPTLSLSDLLLRAQENNPDILSARQAWKVSQAQISPTGTWPDPTFTYVDERFPSGISGVPPEKVKHYRIEQTVPFPGKLNGESRMKYHESLIAESKYRAVTLNIFRDVRMRYYQLYLTDQKIDLASQSVDILKNAVKTAQARLASGQSTTLDVFMAQTELRRMENEQYEQQQQRTLISIELNTLLNQATDLKFDKTQPPPLTDLPLDLGDFRQIARRNAPEYMTAVHELNHAHAMTVRNRLAWAPDFGVMYEKETASGGEDGRQIGVSVTFPLWFNRPWNLSKAAQEHEQEALASSEAMQNEVLKMIHIEMTEAQTYLGLARSYEVGILPSAMSSLRVAREQYASGHGDFLRLLEAFRAWIEAHNQYQDKVYHYAEHWSELGRWLGVDVDHAKEALDQQEVMPMGNHNEK